MIKVLQEHETPKTFSSNIHLQTTSVSVKRLFVSLSKAFTVVYNVNSYNISFYWSFLQSHVLSTIPF